MYLEKGGLFANIIEKIKTVANPTTSKIRRITETPNQILNQQNPFYEELLEEYDFPPPVLKSSKTMPSLVFNSPSSYPKNNSDKLILSNDFLLDPDSDGKNADYNKRKLRNHLELKLGSGFATTYDWQSSDMRKTTAQVALISDNGDHFKIFVSDETRTYGNLLRNSQDARENPHPASKPFAEAVEKLKHNFSNKQSDWISKDGQIRIVRETNDAKPQITAIYDREGNVDVVVREAREMTAAELSQAALRAGAFIDQPKYQDYQQSRPDFRQILTKSAKTNKTVTTTRKATPEEETDFFQTLSGSSVDQETTEKMYSKQKANFSMFGDFHNLGRAYWIDENKRPWTQHL